MARRGTNYNERMRQDQRRRTDTAAIGTALSQAVRCEQGTHDEAVADPRRVTYVRGRQVQPGTRYCRYCSLILGEETSSGSR